MAKHLSGRHGSSTFGKIFLLCLSALYASSACAALAMDPCVVGIPQKEKNTKAKTILLTSDCDSSSTATEARNVHSEKKGTFLTGATRAEVEALDPRNKIWVQPWPDILYVNSDKEIGWWEENGVAIHRSSEITGPRTKCQYSDCR